MSGNVWMFSDQIDDEDLEFLAREFVTYNPWPSMQLCGFGLIFDALGSDSVFHNECGLGAGYPRDNVFTGNCE